MSDDADAPELGKVDREFFGEAIDHPERDPYWAAVEEHLAMLEE